MTILTPDVSALLAANADLTTHHIEGIAVHGDTPFKAPLVSHVRGNLWMGGHPWPGVRGFRAVLNLYPWGPAYPSDGVEVRPVRMYDAAETPDPGQVGALVDWVVERMAEGPVLVHCQAGLNRSGLIAAMVLVREGMASRDAIALLREKRSPAVLCNATFAAWVEASA